MPPKGPYDLEKPVVRQKKFQPWDGLVRSSYFSTHPRIKFVRSRHPPTSTISKCGFHLPNMPNDPQVITILGFYDRQCGTQCGQKSARPARSARSLGRLAAANREVPTKWPWRACAQWLPWTKSCSFRYSLDRKKHTCISHLLFMSFCWSICDSINACVSLEARLLSLKENGTGHGKCTENVGEKYGKIHPSPSSGGSRTHVVPGSVGRPPPNPSKIRPAVNKTRSVDPGFAGRPLEPLGYPLEPLGYPLEPLGYEILWDDMR